MNHLLFKVAIYINIIVSLTSYSKVTVLLIISDVDIPLW